MLSSSLQRSTERHQESISLAVMNFPEKFFFKAKYRGEGTCLGSCSLVQTSDLSNARGHSYTQSQIEPLSTAECGSKQKLLCTFNILWEAWNSMQNWTSLHKT